jgi:hypothetical protein
MLHILRELSYEIRIIFGITVRFTYISGAGIVQSVALGAAHGASLYELPKCFLTKIGSWLLLFDI